MTDIDAFNEVEVVEFGDAIVAGGLVDIEGEHGTVFFPHAANAHCADIDAIIVATSYSKKR